MKLSTIIVVAVLVLNGTPGHADAIGTLEKSAEEQANINYITPEQLNTVCELSIREAALKFENYRDRTEERDREILTAFRQDISPLSGINEKHVSLEVRDELYRCRKKVTKFMESHFPDITISRIHLWFPVVFDPNFKGVTPFTSRKYQEYQQNQTEYSSSQPSLAYFEFYLSSVCFIIGTVGWLHVFCH